MRLLLVSCLVVCLVFARAQAKPLALAETPPAVQKVITAQLGSGTLDDIDQTNQNGETTFDVSFTAKTGDEHGFTVADDGTLLSLEVVLAETPAAVRRAIVTHAAGWQLEYINKNVSEAEPSFEAYVSQAGREKSFTLGSAGELLSMEVTLAETPVAVRAAVTNQLAGGSVHSIDENFDSAGDNFDVEARSSDGARKSFSVAMDGSLLSEEVSLKNIPPAARKAIREIIGGGKILRIDKLLVERKAGVLPYAVTGRKDGKPFNFSIGPRGKFLGMDD